MANENTTSDFEKGVLEYIRKSNVGSQKAGYGPLSIRSQQRGNTDIASALMEIKKISANDGFDKLDKLGKNLLEKISEMAEESIFADAATQKHSLEQIAVLKELLPLVEEGNEEQKRSKKDLIAFIGKTEKGMLKNASFKNRLIEFTKAVLPSAAGIVSAIASRSPMVGAAINFGLEKLQERQERKDQNKKDSVKSLISALEYARTKPDDEEDDRPKNIKEQLSDNRAELERQKKEAIPVEVVNIPSDPRLSLADEDIGTLHDFYLGVEDAIRENGLDQETIDEVVRQTKEAVDEFTRGDPEKVKEFLNIVVSATQGTEEGIEKLSSIIGSNEEAAREDRFQMMKQNAILERVADGIEEGRTNGKDGKDGEDRSLKDRILGWLGLGAAGTTVLAQASKFLSKFKGLVGFVTKILSKIPGLGLISKAFGKLASFPAQFVLALMNGLKNGVQSLMKGEGLATALEKTLYGFANWFLVGFLEKIQNFFSKNKIVQALIRPFFKIAATIEDFANSALFYTKKAFNMAVEFAKSPVEGIKAIGKTLATYWDSIIAEVHAYASDPKTFIRGKLEQLREGIKKFFFSMVPSWIPLKFIPANMREDVKKARYGGDDIASTDARMMAEPELGDAIVQMVQTKVNTIKPPSPAATPAPQAQVEDEEYDPLVSMAERMVAATSKATARSTRSTEDLIGRLLVREGGFVNDPTDRGGATNMGITQKTLSGHMGRPATIEDVRNLSEETARAIYDKQYLDPFKEVQDDRLKEFLFDSGVNHGTERAKGWFEEAKASGGSEQEIFEKLIDRRGQFYKDIIANDPSQKRFEKGWNNRLAEFEQKAKEGRADAMYSVTQQIAKSEKAKESKPPAVVSSVSNRTTNNTSQTHVSRKSPVNQDPSARFYAPNLASA